MTMPITLRPATATDQKSIRDLIHQVGINPMNLDWERFIVAEDNGSFIGCVQLKPHSDGVRELASLAVVPERQGQGIGGELVRALLARDGKDELYLTCRSNLTPYYEQFGFKVVDFDHVPGSFRIQMRIGRLLAKLTKFEGLSVMRREPSKSR
jgi:N-acetylglutamate synthase-like GNAT family acetyltransferase